MTSQERESLRPECVKRAPSQNLLDARAAKELAIQHLFEQVSVKRELHVAGMLLRRGIARVSEGDALAWARSDSLFVRPDPDGKLLTTLEVRDAENSLLEEVLYRQLLRGARAGVIAARVRKESAFIANT